MLTCSYYVDCIREIAKEDKRQSSIKSSN